MIVEPMVEVAARPVAPAVPASDEQAIDVTVDPPEAEGGVVRAAAAEKRLRNALRELKHRGDHVADEVRAVAMPLRMVAAALAAGIGAVLILMTVRAVARRRPARRPRSLARAVARSLVAELATRAALGAATVVGARIASDFVLPAIARRLAEEADGGRPTPKRRRARPPAVVQPTEAYVDDAPADDSAAD